jgi:chromosome segregation ATPase
MLFINGLMVERDLDYTETIVNGQVTSATLLGDAAELADSGAKLMTYGVRGVFEDIVAVDYAFLIQNAQTRLIQIEVELTQAATDRENSNEEYQGTVASLQAGLTSLISSVENTTTILEEEEDNLQNLQNARQDALDTGNQVEADRLLDKIISTQNDINDLNALIENDNQEINTIQTVLNQLETAEQDSVIAYEELFVSLETERAELETQIADWETLLNG